MQLLVKKDAMLDSLDARERSYDNSTNDINFMIRKVNLMYVFIVVVWIFFFSKYVIQNPVFFVYNVIRFYHTNGGVLQEFPALGNAVTTHVKIPYLRAPRIILYIYINPVK